MLPSVSVALIRLQPHQSQFAKLSTDQTQSPRLRPTFSPAAMLIPMAVHARIQRCLVLKPLRSRWIDMIWALCKSLRISTMWPYHKSRTSEFRVLNVTNALPVRTRKASVILNLIQKMLTNKPHALCFKASHQIKTIAWFILSKTRRHHRESTFCCWRSKPAHRHHCWRNE